MPALAYPLSPMTPPSTPEFNTFSPIATSPPNQFVSRRSLRMSPTTPPATDMMSSNLLIDPRWSGLSQVYSTAQDSLESERRAALVRNDAGMLQIVMFNWSRSVFRGRGYCGVKQSIN